jgi:hypothetical protein
MEASWGALEPSTQSPQKHLGQALLVLPQKSRPHDNVQVSSLWNMCLYKNSHLAIVSSVIVLPLVQEDTKRNDGNIRRHQRSEKKSPVEFLGMLH